MHSVHDVFSVHSFFKDIDFRCLMYRIDFVFRMEVWRPHQLWSRRSMVQQQCAQHSQSMPQQTYPGSLQPPLVPSRSPGSLRRTGLDHFHTPVTTRTALISVMRIRICGGVKNENIFHHPTESNRWWRNCRKKSSHLHEIMVLQKWSSQVGL